MTTLLRRSVVALSLCAALCALAVAQPPGAAPKDAPKKDVPPAPAKDAPKGGVPPAPKDAPKEAPKDVPVKKEEGLQLKAFEIKIVSPAQVHQTLLNKLATPIATKGGPPPAPPTFHAALDPRTKTVFVRGTAAEIDAAAKLIAQLDDGILLTLQTATVDEVMKVLNVLDLGAKVQSDPQAKTIVVFANDPNVEQIKAVVARMDSVKTGVAPPKK